MAKNDKYIELLAKMVLKDDRASGSKKTTKKDFAKLANSEEFKEFLDSVSLSEGAKKEQEVAEAQQQVLNKAPLQIFIG